MREEGYYWIRIKFAFGVSRYQIAKWDGHTWSVSGDWRDPEKNGNVIDVYGSRLLTPDEIDATEPYKGHTIAVSRDALKSVLTKRPRNDAS